MLDLNTILEKSNSLKELVAGSTNNLSDIEGLKKLRIKLLGPAKAAASVCFDDFHKFLVDSGFQKLYHALEKEVVTKVMPEVKGYDVDYKNGKFLVTTEQGMKAMPIVSIEKFLQLLGITEEKNGYWLIYSHCLRSEVFDVIQLSQFIKD
jgi:hypothetical protein